MDAPKIPAFFSYFIPISGVLFLNARDEIYKEIKNNIYNGFISVFPVKKTTLEKLIFGVPEKDKEKLFADSDECFSTTVDLLTNLQVYEYNLRKEIINIHFLNHILSKLKKGKVDENFNFENDIMKYCGAFIQLFETKEGEKESERKDKINQSLSQIKTQLIEAGYTSFFTEIDLAIKYIEYQLKKKIPMNILSECPLLSDFDFTHYDEDVRRGNEMFEQISLDVYKVLNYTFFDSEDKKNKVLIYGTWEMIKAYRLRILNLFKKICEICLGDSDVKSKENKDETNFLKFIQKIEKEEIDCDFDYVKLKKSLDMSPEKNKETLLNLLSKQFEDIYQHRKNICRDVTVRNPKELGTKHLDNFDRIMTTPNVMEFKKNFFFHPGVYELHFSYLHILNYFVTKRKKENEMKKSKK